MTKLLCKSSLPQKTNIRVYDLHLSVHVELIEVVTYSGLHRHLNKTEIIVLNELSRRQDGNDTNFVTNKYNPSNKRSQIYRDNKFQSAKLLHFQGLVCKCSFTKPLRSN